LALLIRFYLLYNKEFPNRAENEYLREFFRAYLVKSREAKTQKVIAQLIEKLNKYRKKQRQTLDKENKYELDEKLDDMLDDKLDDMLDDKLDDMLDEMLDEKLDEKLDDMLDEKLDEKLDDMLDEKLDDMLDDNNIIKLEKELLPKLNEFVTLYINQDEFLNITLFLDKYFDKFFAEYYNLFEEYLPKGQVKEGTILYDLIIFYLLYSEEFPDKEAK
jgi:uncharacterized membrane protein YheB (UPF0754 family)